MYFTLFVVYSVVFRCTPGPNMVWLLGIYTVMECPLLSLYGIIDVTRYISTPTRHALLGPLTMSEKNFLPIT